MPNPGLAPELSRQAYETLQAHGGNQVAAARHLGIARTTLQSRVRHYETQQSRAFEFPHLPDADLPIEALIDRMSKDYARRAAASQAREIIKIKAKTNEPIALCWFGDPHIDDDGCDWPSLRRDIDTIRATPGMYGCNLGDTTNNWVGRLAALYSVQTATKRDGIRLTEWLFSVIPWFVVIAGNHDMWSGDDAPINFLKTHCGLHGDWRARFQIVFPNGTTFDVDARHDHPGHSQDNPLHGQMKAKIRSFVAQDADLIIGGHRHTWAVASNEDGRRNRVTHYVRARGYKMEDHYAAVNGFNQQKLGQSAVTVIDPNAKTPSALCQVFMDVQEGAAYLRFKRSALGTSKRRSA